MKNILIVSPYFYPEGGGLELYASKIARHFSKENKVIVLCSTKKESNTENPNPNLKIIRQRPSFFISNTPVNLKLKNFLESIIEKHDIDIIDAHTPVPFYADIACYVAKKYNIPFILHYHSSSLYKNRPLLDLMAFFYETLFQKRLFEYSKKIVFDSQYPLDRKLSKYKNKSIVSPPPVNTSLFKKLEAERKKEMLFVGQLNKSHKWKGLENLIRAYSLLNEGSKDYKLLIIGGGDYIDHYKALVKRLKLQEKVRFLGRLTQEEIIKYYQTCAFVVIPSISNVEGAPAVIFEAMACGTPIIAATVGGIPCVLKESKCGLLVNAKNIKELTQAINSLAGDKKLSDELSGNCLKNVNRYNEEEMIKEHEIIFSKHYKSKQIEEKRIAIFHNFMDNIGGAEIVALTLARELNADFYTTNIDREKIKKMGFPDVKLNSIGKIPINAPFRHQAALIRFRKLNLRNKYDFYIIAGDWAASSAVNHKPNLWYIHAPTRELWDLYEYVRENMVPGFARSFFDLWVKYNRYLSRKYITHVNTVVCNSRNTQKRIKKYLNRTAIVINPPIEVSKYGYKETQGYWLSVNRLFHHKRVDMQIIAFQKMPEEKLIIVGSYEQARGFKEHANYIKKIKPKNVKILSWVDSDKLIELYSSCKGFIATSRDEDFGMTPIEAMASGKPVIAPNEGGYRETVIDGVTGRLIDDIDVHKLVDAIKEIGKKPGKYKDACLKQAKRFDTKIFVEKIKKEIVTAAGS